MYFISILFIMLTNYRMFKCRNWNKGSSYGAAIQSCTLLPESQLKYFIIWSDHAALILLSFLKNCRLSSQGSPFQFCTAGKFMYTGRLAQYSLQKNWKPSSENWLTWPKKWTKIDSVKCSWLNSWHILSYTCMHFAVWLFIFLVKT